MAKGTSSAEAMSNNEKINPVVIAIIKLHESEGTSQSGRQLVSQSAKNSTK